MGHRLPQGTQALRNLWYMPVWRPLIPCLNVGISVHERPILHFNERKNFLNLFLNTYGFENHLKYPYYQARWRLFQVYVNYWISIMIIDMFKRPDVSWAVLKTPLSLTNYWLSESPFVSQSSNHHKFQIVKARDLKCWHNVHNVSYAKCHALHVTCQCHM